MIFKVNVTRKKMPLDAFIQLVEFCTSKEIIFLENKYYLYIIGSNKALDFVINNYLKASQINFKLEDKIKNLKVKNF